MSVELALFGPPPASSATWFSTGTGSSILDCPSYLDGHTRAVTLLLTPGKSVAGQCFLEVYQRNGESFARVQSTPLDLDYGATAMQIVSVAPVPVRKGDYLGLRMASGQLFTQWTDGPSAHMWWSVNPTSGKPDRYVSMDSAGIAVTIESDYQRDATWHSVTEPSSGRALRWSASEQPGVFLFLPTAFHLDVRPGPGLPGLDPFLYLRDGAGASPTLSDYRVRLRLTAVPTITPVQRDFLRNEILRLTQRPAVRLQPATGLPASLQITIGPESSAAPTTGQVAVDIGSGFTLEYDLLAAEYSLVREQLLAAGGGIEGHVYVPLGPQDQGVIEVRLSLRNVQLDVVDAHSGTGAHMVHMPGNRLILQNRIDQPVRVEDLRVVMGGGQYEPPAQASAGIATPSLPIDLPASGSVTVSCAPAGHGGPWRLWDWQVMKATLSDGTPDEWPQQWIDRIDRGPLTGNALLPIAVYVTNLAQRKKENVDFVGVKVAVPGALPGDGVLRADATDPWKAQLARSLSEVVGGAGAMSFDLEFQNVYSDGLGLPQRIASQGENAVLPALAFEPAGCHYAILDEKGASLFDGLDRAAAQKAIDDLRAQQHRWSLVVQATG